jgi:metal-sulfur cluster biosynthetic enzyme
MSESQEVVKKLKGVKKVQVEFVFDPPWTPKMISDEAKALLGI